jgi:hypothetical protein
MEYIGFGSCIRTPRGLARSAWLGFLAMRGEAPEVARLRGSGVRECLDPVPILAVKLSGFLPRRASHRLRHRLDPPARRVTGPARRCSREEGSGRAGRAPGGRHACFAGCARRSTTHPARNRALRAIPEAAHRSPPTALPRALPPPHQPRCAAAGMQRSAVALEASSPLRRLTPSTTRARSWARGRWSSCVADWRRASSHGRAPPNSWRPTRPKPTGAGLKGRAAAGGGDPFGGLGAGTAPPVPSCSCCV